MKAKLTTLQALTTGLGLFHRLGTLRAGLAALCAVVTIGCGGGGGGGSAPVVLTAPSDIVYERDEDNDDVIDGTWTFVHNTAGQIVRLEAESIDDYSVIFSYDGDGNHILSEVYDDTSTLRMIFDFTYDADGNLLLIEGDEDLDDVPDFCVENTYNADGQLELMEDTDCAGTVNRYMSFGWNADGNMAWKVDSDSMTTDLDTYAYDASGNLSTITYDDGDDGIIDTVEALHWTADAVGTENYINHMLFMEWGPFLPNYFLTPYRMVSHLTMIESDDGDDGIIDRAHYFHYDAHGNINRFETDQDMDSTMDSIEYFTW